MVERWKMIGLCVVVVVWKDSGGCSIAAAVMEVALGLQTRSG